MVAMKVIYLIIVFAVTCGAVYGVVTYEWDYRVARERYGYSRANALIYTWAASTAYEKIYTVAMVILTIAAWFPIIIS